MGNSMSGDTSAVQSVDRALQILAIISDKGESGVTEIATELGVHKSTASRLMSALLEHNMVEQVSERGRFRLGLGLVRLAGQVSASQESVTGSRTITRALATAVGETVNIAVLDGNQVLYLDQVAGNNIMSLRSWIGQVVPTYCTATGKALVAWLEPAARKRTYPEKWVKFTANTITDAKTFENELEQVRQQGFAAASEEIEIGLIAIAAPICDSHGDVIATVAVSGPAFRITPDRIDTIAEQVMQAAHQLSGKADI
ncbi:MAG: IclR family transcriptional regulator [Actinomycetes bacterium]